MQTSSKGWPLWTRVLVALFVGNGLAYAAYVRYQKSAGANPALAVAEVPEIAETKISFASTPSGAKVSEQGVVLGITPFIRAYPRMGPRQSREFTFELEGHAPAKVEAFLDQERIYVHTSLAVATVVVPPPNVATLETEQVAEVADKVVERPAVRRSRPREIRENRENRDREPQPQSRAVPRLDDEPTAVPKLDEDSDPRAVPKLDDRRTGVPKLSDDEPATPKMIDDERTVVPKLKD